MGDDAIQGRIPSMRQCGGLDRGSGLDAVLGRLHLNRFPRGEGTRSETPLDCTRLTKTVDFRTRPIENKSDDPKCTCEHGLWQGRRTPEIVSMSRTEVAYIIFLSWTGVLAWRRQVLSTGTDVLGVQSDRPLPRPPKTHCFTVSFFCHR